MERWLIDQHYHLIASDMHGPLGLVPRLSAIERLRQHSGIDLANEMLGTRPCQLLPDAGT
jgi:hypothetical protein